MNNPLKSRFATWIRFFSNVFLFFSCHIFSFHHPPLPCPSSFDLIWLPHALSISSITLYLTTYITYFSPFLHICCHPHCFSPCLPVPLGPLTLVSTYHVLLAPAHASFPPYATFLALSALLTTTSFSTSSLNRSLSSCFALPFLCFDLYSCCCIVHIHFPHSYLLLLILSSVTCPCPWLPYHLSVQCPWGPSPHPCSRCSMPPAGQAWVPWASPSSCWRTTSRWRSQRWTSITMRWTSSPTSAHGESTGKITPSQWFFLHVLSVMSHIHSERSVLLSCHMCHKRLLTCGSKACILIRSQQVAGMSAAWNSLKLNNESLTVTCNHSAFQEAATTALLQLFIYFYRLITMFLCRESFK